MGRAGGGQGRAWPLRAEVQGRFPLLQDPSLGAPVPSSGGSPAGVPRSSLLICHDRSSGGRSSPRVTAAHPACPALTYSAPCALRSPGPRWVPGGPPVSALQADQGL